MTPASLTQSSQEEFSKGVRFALLAYMSWGLFPIFWKLLQNISAVELLCHRLFWSFVFYTLIRAVREKKLSLKHGQSSRDLRTLFIASIVLTANWLLYIYAVNAGYIVEASLGYFINPLVNIVLGIFFLGETLKKHHKLAIFLAVVGVLFISLGVGRPPWIALILGLSFGSYGMLRKKLKFTSLIGGQWETLLFLPLVLIYFYFNGESLHSHTAKEWALLVASGAVTGLPLLWFSEAVKRLPYYLMGFFQFLAPSMMFLSGIFIYKEVVTPLKLLGFVCIWGGILWLLINGVNAKGYFKKKLAPPI